MCLIKRDFSRQKQVKAKWRLTLHLCFALIKLRRGERISWLRGRDVMLGPFSDSTIQLLMLLLFCSLSLFTVKLPLEVAWRGSATIELLKFAIWDHTDSAELTTMINATWTPPLQNCWGAHQAQNLASYCWSESPTLEKDATVDFCFISETSFAPLLAVLQDKTINTSQVYCSASTSRPRLWYTKSIEGERERKKEGNSISLCTRLENVDSWLWARKENNCSVLAEAERTRLT